MNSIEIFEADLSAGDQAVAVVDLLNGYAKDPMGGGKPLSGFALENLIPRLKERQDTLVKVTEIARERGCCKLTLEVLERNHAAQKAYRSFGFAPYELAPETGMAMFWEKKL